MGNLSDLLKNPTSQVDTVAALVEAVLLDEQASGSTGTAGKLPLFSDSETLENSPVDVGLTFADTIFIDATGVDGAPSCASIGAGAGGVYIDAVADGVHAGSADGKILVVSGKGLQLMNTPKNSTGSSVLVVNGDTGGLSLDGGAGGILVWPYLVPSSLYSAAGRPLPTPSSALKGAQAIVSDAVTPAYMVAYTGGALGVLCAVICDGTTWFTH